jgi:DNA polymerase-3 subunit gamma/tau
MFEFADALAARDTGAALRIVASAVEEGSDLRLLVRQVLEHLRALFVVQRVTDATDLLDATDETLARLSAQAEHVEPGALVHALRLFADAQAEIRQQAPPRLTIEIAVVRATVPEADTTAEAAIARVERLERLLDVGGVPAVRPAPEPARTEPPKPAAEPARKAARKAPPTSVPASTAAAPEQTTEEPAPARHGAAELVDLEKVKRDWPVVLDEVRKVRKSLHALLAEGRPRALAEGTLQLECRYDYHARQLAEPRNSAVIAEAIHTVLGVTLRLQTLVGATPVEPEAPPAEDEPASSDPLDVLSRRLGAEVIEETDG